MRRIFVSVVLVAIVLIGCPLPMSDWGGSTLVPDGAAALLPPDQVRDVARTVTGPFTFETLYSVSINLTVDLYDTDARGHLVGDPLPAGMADVIVTLADSDGNHIYTGQVSEDGTLKTVIYVPAAAEDAVLTLSANGFEERSVTLNDLADYSEIDRTMSLQRIVSVDGMFVSRSVSGLLDSDGDGVPDVYDDFPYESGAAFQSHVPPEGMLTIAFEDLFGQANAGDADYNDFVGAYSITEITNNEGQVTAIEVESRAITKLAGYDHTFGIRIDAFRGDATLTGTYIDAGGAPVAFGLPSVGEVVRAPAEIVLFENSRNAFNDPERTDGKIAKFTLTFVYPQDHMDRMVEYRLSNPPYNPFAIVINTGQNTHHDIHLIGREPLTGSINPGDDFVDADGFPWALLVPADWIHPDEGQRIDFHYPRFEDWRLSEGTAHTDWYNYYDDPWVEPPAGGPDVYVAGFYDDGSRDVAAYWEIPGDGSPPVRTDLTQGVPPGSDAWANDVFVIGSDIYVAGYYQDGTDSVALYWQNGIASPGLSLAGESGEATGIFVDGPDVYLSGTIADATAKSAVYWINHSSTPLHSSSTADAARIVVSGGDVLVPGTRFGGPLQSFASTLWRVPNGGVLSEIDLSGGAISEAFDVDVGPSGEIYVAGSYYNMGHFASVYWTIDPGDFSFTQTNLYDVGGNWSKAFGIDEEAGTVYSAGYYVDAYDLPAYWAGGSLNPLEGSEGKALDIDVWSGVAYVAGFLGAGPSRYAVIWEDGIATELPRFGTLAAEARAVFVVEQ